MSQARPQKICHVFGRLDRAGAETRTVECMRHLAGANVEFHICSIAGLPGVPEVPSTAPLDDEIRAMGGIIHPCRIGRSFPREFRLLLRQQCFNVVHAHLFYFSGYLLRLAAREGVPVRVAHLRDTHDHHTESPLRSLRRRLMRHWINRHATHILAVSKAAMETAWRPDWTHDSRCRVVYDGVDTSPFTLPADRGGVRLEFGFSPDCPLYLHVGRMVPSKNHARVLEIFHEIVRREPAAHLLFVGRGGNEIEDRLRKEIARRGLEGRVVLTGIRADVPRLLLAADLLLYPSLSEGLPGVVLEACAAVLPVLASDLPSIREIAANLTSVEQVSLATSNRVWAQRAEALRIDSTLTTPRDRDREAFAASMFGILECAKTMCEVWGLPPSKN